MKISSSSVSLQGEHSNVNKNFKIETAGILFTNTFQNRISKETKAAQMLEATAKSNISSALGTNYFTSTVSQRAEEREKKENVFGVNLIATTMQAEKNNDDIEQQLKDLEERMRLDLVRILFQRFKGKDVSFKAPIFYKKPANAQDDLLALSTVMPSANNAANAVSTSGVAAISYFLGSLSLALSSTQKHVEEETVTFQSGGKIKTADGKQIDFSVDFNMSRSFASTNNISSVKPMFIDPLVLNFDAPAAQLSNTKFSFDIDSDGKQEQLASLQQGSGFLALDKNNDNKIDDGNELFGTKSGNGFADLAQCDKDKNNWIDENDDIYSKLRIFTKDKDGNDKLFALGEKGIGAIYLGSTDTAFTFKSGLENNTLGQLKSTGVFLKENGNAGTIQQIDFNPTLKPTVAMSHAMASYA